MSLVLLFVGVVSAMGAQSFTRTVAEGQVRLDYVWKDHDAVVRSLKLTLSEADIAADEAANTPFPTEACQAALGESMREAAAKHGAKVELQPGLPPCGMTWRVTAPASRLPAASAAVSAAHGERYQAFLAEHGRISLDNTVRRDHARLVREAAPRLRALADALYQPLDDVRSFADSALAFVQSIPYARIPKEIGMRLPLALLSHNEGDCDGKSVLFLGILRARFPEVRTAMMYVPEHAYVALAIPADLDDVGLRDPEGVEWVIAEPVGPKLARLGVPGQHSQDPSVARRWELR